MVKKRFSVGDLFALPAENDVGCAVGQIVLERDSGQYFVAIASDFFDHFEDAMRFSNQNPQVILAAVVLDEYLLSGKWEVFSNDSVWSSVSFPVYKGLTPQGFFAENIDRTARKACIKEQAALLSNRRVISAAAFREVVTSRFGFGAWRDADNVYVNGYQPSEDQVFGFQRSHQR